MKIQATEKMRRKKKGKKKTCLIFYYTQNKDKYTSNQTVFKYFTKLVGKLFTVLQSRILAGSLLY